MSVVSCSQQLPSLDGQAMGRESSTMTIIPQKPVSQTENLGHSIMSIDNHWQDLELVPFSSQALEGQPPTSFGDTRQPMGIDEYDFEQHALKHFGEASYNGSQRWPSTGSNEVVELKTSSSISSSGTPKLGMQKMLPRHRHSQGISSPKSANAETHSLPPVIDKELAAPSNQLTKIQNRSGNSGGTKKAVTNKRVKQTVEPTPPAEPLPESSESVRIKMRESLAVALKLVLEEGSSNVSVEGNENCNTTKVQEEEKSGDVEAGVRVDSSANKLGCLKEVPVETNFQKFGVNGSSVAFSDTSESNTSNTVLEQGNRNASTDGDVSTDQMSKDDLQSSSRLSLASNVNSEGCEDKENNVSKKLKLAHGSSNEIGRETPQRLASEIEDELFRLFGGVNKKYKEKGRSLLFNLKDRHNPELRKRVFSGEISPLRLCSMTAEELASKELTQWRIAKAEELAQMVVLPDSDKEFKSFVKKTHKGEVEVEVERDDSASVEVVLAGNAFSRSGYTDKGAEVGNLSNSSKKNDSFPELPGSDSMLLDSLTSEQHESTYLMHHLMVEEFRDSNSLISVPTLDEFMKDLDEEPPFQNMMVGTVQGSPSSVKGTIDISKAYNHAISCYSEAAVANSLVISGNIAEPQENSAVQVDAASMSDVKAESTETSPVGCKKGQAMGDMHGRRDPADVKFSENDARIAATSTINNAFLGRSLSDRFKSAAVNNEPVWDGLIQLNISSLVTALGFYRSGVKASMKEWPTFLEIKGRVRLNSFETFLQDLRLCRSRAIMILQLCWKEGSPESGRVKLCETIDSYVADERVGFAEPFQGLELYFCPPHPTTTQILKANLPKEHAQAVTSVHSGFVCVALWRRESPEPSPERLRLPTAPSSFPQQPPSQQRPANVAPGPYVRDHLHHCGQLPPAKEGLDDDDDDVPPGFGPPAVVATRDEDDLPEFDFVQSISTATSNNDTLSPTGYASSKPLNHQLQPAAQKHFRELITKYGQNQNQIPSRNVMAAGDSDEDDIPEWQPHQQDSHMRQQTPTPHPYTRPPPPLPNHHYNQQPNAQPMVLPQSDHLPSPPSNYQHPPHHQHQPRQFPAAGQWANVFGDGCQQPWSGAAPRPTQPQQYCGGRPLPQWRPGRQWGRGRSRGGHFPRG